MPKPSGPTKPKKDGKLYEFRIYKNGADYSGNYELLATVTQRFKNVYTENGRAICSARVSAEEYVRNIGLYGITIEFVPNVFTYYPPVTITKVEYNIVVAESDDAKE